jgi:RNA polymerase sigma factor (sigma-70 family)
MAQGPSNEDHPKPAGIFPNTRWSMVLAARDSPSIERGDALSELCRLYWKPVYLFIRKHGHSPEETEDLTQEFFYRLIEGDLLQSVSGPERGRLRSFICLVLKRFLADDYHKKMTQKRGGRQKFVEIDRPSIEGQLVEESRDTAPERAFDRQWALGLLEESLQRLKDDYSQAGKSGMFEALEPTISPRMEHFSHSDLARELGMKEGSVKVAVHRFRQRYRECMLSALRDTLEEGQKPEEELRYLLSLFSPG